MEKWFFKVLVCTVNVFILAKILSGVHIKDIFTAIVVAIVLSLLDMVIKPLLIILTLPATIFTLGLFLFVINACIILLDDHFVHGFDIDGFWYTLLFSMVYLSSIPLYIKKLFLKRKKPRDKRSAAFCAALLLNKIIG